MLFKGRRIIINVKETMVIITNVKERDNIKFERTCTEAMGRHRVGDKKQCRIDIWT